MPTYEYVCRVCGHLFEIVQSMRDAALTECPECGGDLRKVFAPPSIAFKGSGFYATDHRKKATTSGDKGETGDKGDKADRKERKDGKETPAKEGTSKADKAAPSSTGSKTDSSPGSAGEAAKER
jgi:putative FmdB family regulatory protein